MVVFFSFRTVHIILNNKACKVDIINEVSGKEKGISVNVDSFQGEQAKNGREIDKR